MSDLEKSIKQYMADESWQLASPREFGLRVESRAHHLRRRRRLAISAAAIAFVGIVGGVTGALLGSGGPARGSRRIVAWRNTPAPVRVRLTKSQSVSAPACGASDLNIVSTHPGAWQGQAVLVITIQNSGITACTLAGTPTATGVTSSGANVSFQGQSTPPTGVLSSLLNSGDQAIVWISALGSCSQPSPNGKLNEAQIDIPGGGALTISTPQLNVGCGGLEVSPFMLQTTPAVPPPGPLSGLTASTTLPSTVSPGSTLDYSITISNPTSSAVSLNACPAYSEQLGTVASASYELNCSPGEIPAGSSMTFAMQLAVPANAPAGETKFLWFMNNGPAAYGVIDVS